MTIAFRILLTLIALLFINISFSQDIFGKWKTIDDRTGNPKGVIHIYKKDGKIFGKVVEVLESGKEDGVCVKCKGYRKNKPFLGMVIIKDLKKHDDGVYKGKELFDPEQAMTFRCKIWLDPDNTDELKVRGYLAFIYRTQTWLRVIE